MSYIARQRASVLVVDDDQFLCAYVANAIREEGDFDVTEAADGAQAKIFCNTSVFDVVVTDLNMPVVDGLQTDGMGSEKLPRSRVDHSVRRRNF